MALSTLTGLAIGLVLFYYVIYSPIYNVFFHPLHKFPGPKLWAASQLPSVLTYASGHQHKKSLALHNKYGPVVRTGPNEMSYLQPESWEAICGHRKAGQSENGKAEHYKRGRPNSILGVDRENHARMRKLMSYGFAPSTMVEQQPIIIGYIDLLIRRLRERCQPSGGPVEMAAWFNYTTFDIIGDLTFGESFRCLQDAAMHPWIAMAFGNAKIGAMASGLSQMPLLRPLLPLFVGRKMIKQSMECKQLIREKVSQRLAIQSPRPDFMYSMTSDKAGLSMSRVELNNNAEVLVLAGSETTATALAVITFMLTTNPTKLAKVADEVLSSFTAEEEIDLLSTAKLSYLNAVIKESLRSHPPIPNSMPRGTPPEGNEVFGDWIPGGTVLKIPQWAMYHSESNFKRPFEFIPERWLDDPEFANDRRDCMQAFSVGARDCIGQNLAWAELRTIVSRLLWNFDIEITDESRDWADRCTSYNVWQKGELWVNLKPRKAV